MKFVAGETELIKLRNAAHCTTHSARFRNMLASSDLRARGRLRGMFLDFSLAMALVLHLVEEGAESLLFTCEPMLRSFRRRPSWSRGCPF